MDNRVGRIADDDLQNILIVIEKEVAGSALGSKRSLQFAYVFLMKHPEET